jgi:hypothetical protein
MSRYVSSEDQFFVDDHLIESMSGLKRVLQTPLKCEQNPVLQGDRPAEGWVARILGNSVHFDAEESIFKMWYDTTGGVAYATSKDGVSWDKPTLGVLEVDGSRDNNLVCPGRNLTVTKDLIEKDPAKRYKGLYWHSLRDPEAKWAGKGHFAAFSADGIHWDHTPENPVMEFSHGATDGQSVFGWDPHHRKYVVYQRPHAEFFNPSKRSVGWSASADFIHWDPCVSVMAPDKDDARYEEFYRMSVVKYESLYLGFLWIYDNDPDFAVQTLNTQLTVSRDGVTWDRAAHRQYLLTNGAAGSFDSYYACVCTMIPVGDELFFYYLGANFPHTPRGEGGKKGSQKLLIGTEVDGERMAFAPGLAKLPRGRIVSIQPVSEEPGSGDTASEDTGVLTTQTLRYAGSRLTLNADASQGSIAVEVLDEDGNPVEGCSLSDSIPITEDGFRCTVKWQGDRELVKACTEGTEIAGYEPALRRPQKLRFHIKNARLFSFRID